MQIAMSSGHGKYVAGASGYIEEHPEAVKVVNKVAEFLRAAGVGIETYEDTVSKTQNENLSRLCDWHNSRERDLDVSVHFNCNVTTSKPVGTECLYVTQEDLAGDVATAIARASGLIDRGPKYRDGLYFLNNTEEPAILIEVCFVDSKADVDIYRAKFDALCGAIADAIGGEAVAPPLPGDEALLHVNGRCSWFGGPNDTGVAPDEGLAFIYKVSDAPHLFLPAQPPGTTGLARRLDPDVFYVACRWDYGVTPKSMLVREDTQALVRAGDRERLAWPADWGPNTNTNRIADISPGLMAALGIETDDVLEVIYPAPAVVPVPPEPAEVATVDIVTTGKVRVTVNGQVVATPDA